MTDKDKNRLILLGEMQFIPRTNDATIITRANTEGVWVVDGDGDGDEIEKEQKKRPLLNQLLTKRPRTPDRNDGVIEEHFEETTELSDNPLETSEVTDNLIADSYDHLKSKSFIFKDDEFLPVMTRLEKIEKRLLTIERISKLSSSYEHDVMYLLNNIEEMLVATRPSSCIVKKTSPAVKAVQETNV